jgi:hypothetical protein
MLGYIGEDWSSAWASFTLAGVLLFQKREKVNLQIAAYTFSPGFLKISQLKGRD